MLPMTLAFALLVAICAASVGLAIMQKALSLAMLASIGGYLAPLLLSTGGGSHVALFSFYLLLSVGILAISIWQHWRELNLLGLLFTFGIGGLWGLDGYRSEYYLSSQLFLIANTIIFGVLSVALSLRAQEKGKQIIDGVLLFASPLVGFGMQYAITRHMEYGPALSALGYGGFYLALAWLALRRYPLWGGRWCWRRWRWVGHLPRSLSHWRFRPAGRRWPGRWKVSASSGWACNSSSGV